ncbi:MAG: lysophospholipid acyltransferase family protein [Bacteroidetes bacterium]|nr:lysophospholipid acyltransferase family protein [Bacteroidota bacterium]
MKNENEYKPGIIDYVVSCYFWSSLYLISMILFPVSITTWLVTILFDKKRILLHKFTCTWSDIVLSINPYWKVRVEGKKKIEPHKVYVMVSNHQSGADILVLFKLHRHYKWVAKRSLFYVPFIGWNMWLNGYISIVRTRGRSKLMMMDKAASSVMKGNSVMLFPEGTRTRDGNIQPFKTGAFRLALDTESAILPIAIKGTFSAIRKASLLIHKNYDLKVTVLDPIPFEVISEMEPKEIAELVHDQIRAELEKEQ